MFIRINKQLKFSLNGFKVLMNQKINEQKMLLKIFWGKKIKQFCFIQSFLLSWTKC